MAKKKKVEEEWHSHLSAGTEYVHAHEGGHNEHIGVRGAAFNGPRPRPSDEELGIPLDPNAQRTEAPADDVTEAEDE